MSRITTGDVIVQKPSNNVYTILAAIGSIVTIIALILFITKSIAILGDGWFTK